MKVQTSWISEHSSFLLVLAVVGLSGLSGQLAVQNYALRIQYEPLAGQLASSTDAYQQVTSSLREKFLVASQRNDMLSATLSQEQLKTVDFQAQLNGIKGSVDYLQKLSETDKELLQKYSKVYFLNENYVPSALSFVDQSYISNKSAQIEVHAKIWPYLKNMIDAANTDKTKLKIISAYRSFGQQTTLKLSYKMKYGSGANTFSADQGYSEHQLGSAVDFTTDDLGDGFSQFSHSDGYTWLSTNAYKYGFILSYPKSNAFYIAEPWHWRFVGTALAARLHDENKNFYDMNQRDIDKYLALIFN